MGIFTPIFFAAKAFNTVTNVYFASQIGWWVYKEVRSMQKEKLQADELKQRFIREYTKQFGMKPTDDMVSTALMAYNAVEKPIKHRIDQTTEVVKTKISEGYNSLCSWKESYEKAWADARSIHADSGNASQE